MYSSSAFAFVLAALAVSGTPPAQSAGLGQPLSFHFDVQSRLTAFMASSAAWNKCVGCARDQNGYYWVSAGNPNWSAANPVPGALAKLDRQGVVLRVIAQPAAAATSFGIRDLAYDGATTIYGGVENVASNARLFAFDLATETFLSNSGWQCPVVVGQGSNVVRGLAYDPAGAGGQGTMWTCDFGPEILEFDRAGTVRRTIVVPGTNPLPYGLALDPHKRSLWLFCLGDSTRAEARVVAIEIDIASGTRTGTMCLGDMSVPSLGGLAGGCEFFVDHGQPTLLLLAQADADTMYEMGGRFTYGQTCGGSIAMSGDAAWSGNRHWAVSLRGSNQTLAGLVMQLYPDATPLPPPVFAPGCTLLVGAPILHAVVPIQAGTATSLLPLPPGFAGLPLFLQWVELGSLVCLSDGGMVTLGF